MWNCLFSSKIHFYVEIPECMEVYTNFRINLKPDFLGKNNENPGGLVEF